MGRNQWLGEKVRMWRGMCSSLRLKPLRRCLIMWRPRWRQRRRESWDHRKADATVRSEMGCTKSLSMLHPLELPHKTLMYETWTVMKRTWEMNGREKARDWENVYNIISNDSLAPRPLEWIPLDTPYMTASPNQIQLHCINLIRPGEKKLHWKVKPIQA